MKVKTCIFYSVCSFIVGGIGGVIFEKRNTTKRLGYSGTLRIDNSEVDEPEKLFLELNRSLDELSKEKVVIFKVIKRNYISQK
jgi:hypothetical protein